MRLLTIILSSHFSDVAKLVDDFCLTIYPPQSKAELQAQAQSLFAAEVKTLLLLREQLLSQSPGLDLQLINACEEKLRAAIEHLEKLSNAYLV